MNATACFALAASLLVGPPSAKGRESRQRFYVTRNSNVRLFVREVRRTDHSLREVLSLLAEK